MPLSRVIIAKSGQYLVIHHELTSITRKAKGVDIKTSFQKGLNTAILKIHPTYRKIKLMPNKWICDTRVNELILAP